MGGRSESKACALASSTRAIGRNVWPNGNSGQDLALLQIPLFGSSLFWQIRAAGFANNELHRR
eukprot:14069731-Alexandrium_andersonii.AAC.1